jgi:hypothetical protein
MSYDAAAAEGMGGKYLTLGPNDPDMKPAVY